MPDRAELKRRLIERCAREDGFDREALRDPYRQTEAEERDAEDTEQLEWWLQHAEERPDPEYRA